MGRARRCAVRAVWPGLCGRRVPEAARRGTAAGSRSRRGTCRLWVRGAGERASAARAVPVLLAAHALLPASTLPRPAAPSTASRPSRPHPSRACPQAPPPCSATPPPPSRPRAPARCCRRSAAAASPATLPGAPHTHSDTHQQRRSGRGGASGRAAELGQKTAAQGPAGGLGVPGSCVPLSLAGHECRPPSPRPPPPARPPPWPAARPWPWAPRPRP